MAKAKRKRPTLKDYLRTGVVQLLDTEDEAKRDDPATAKDPSREIVETETPSVEPSSAPSDAQPEAAPPVEDARSIVREVLAMLAPADREMWGAMLAAASSVEREPLDLPAVRERFRTSDKERFTWYLLAEEGAALSPLRTSVQIRPPVCRVIEWDEQGAATVFDGDADEQGEA
ncbi:MAG: hypothetical protein IJR14_06535 [Synergistaceae bacterium]|nr:hypothetical protein [Synergistaceae bacterium]